MSKLTIEQAKKMMEAAKNAKTNPADDKFYPDNKVTTADKIDTGKPKNLPSKKKTLIKAFSKSQSDRNKEKVYNNPFDARKAADDEDRQNLKEIRTVEATKGMKMGGDAHASSCAVIHVWVKVLLEEQDLLLEVQDLKESSSAR
jgi:hypothetical protein